MSCYIFAEKKHEGSDPEVNLQMQKRGGSWGMLRQKILKTRCLRLAKNAFAIQHLLHHSIIYTFIHYPTNFVLLRWDLHF
jgi:hypothetical protein